MNSNEQNRNTNTTGAISATAIDPHWVATAISPIENQARRIHWKHGLTPNLSRLVAGFAYGGRV